MKRLGFFDIRWFYFFAPLSFIVLRCRRCLESGFWFSLSSVFWSSTCCYYSGSHPFLFLFMLYFTHTDNSPFSLLVPAKKNINNYIILIEEIVYITISELAYRVMITAGDNGAWYWTLRRSHHDANTLPLLFETRGAIRHSRAPSPSLPCVVLILQKIVSPPCNWPSVKQWAPSGDNLYVEICQTCPGVVDVGEGWKGPVVGSLPL